MIKKNTQLFTMVLLVLSIVGCNAGKDQTNIEIFDDHFDQVSVKAQDWDPMRNKVPGMLLPPEGTVPKGFKPYPYKYKAMEASKNLKNPLKGNHSPEIIERGKNRYDIYCSVCHGPTGLGDGTVAKKFLLPPPPLVNEKVRKLNDGALFHIITDGQGVMGSYSRQILKHSDRWSVVNYIRTLQKAAKK